MMYQNKFAIALKVGGKILREHGETVYLPFGSEYSILLKNLDNRRACATITLDGKEVVDGGLVISANSSVDLERFIKEGQLEAGNRFKFIERTSKIEQHRGVQLDDGLLRIEVEFEKYTPPPVYHRYLASRGISGQSLNDQSFDSYAMNASYNVGGSASAGEEVRSITKSAGRSIPKNDAGITVEGSVSTQKFQTVSFTGDGQTHVMVLQLRGEIGQDPVKEAFTVKKKQECGTCGHKNKATSKFCSECGTSLEIVCAS